MEALILGIATAFNFIVIKLKFERGRLADATLDLITILLLAGMFGGTVTGMMIAMIASVIISLYLFYNPPKLITDSKFKRILKDKYNEIRPRP